MPPGGFAMQTITLSEAALALFRLHIERHGDIDVDDSNREVYGELERAGVMACGHSFRDGPNSIFKVTKLGFERKAELLAATSPSPGTNGAPRR
jgi:hypothetical protein